MIFKVTAPGSKTSQRVEAIDLDDAIRQMAEEWAAEDGSPDFAFAGSFTYEEM